MTLQTALLERLQATSTPVDVAPVQGSVFPIHLLPDPITGDRLTIGVAFIDREGVSHCQLLNHMDHLRCLYGNRVDVDSFMVVRDLVDAQLQGTQSDAHTHPISDNIHFGQAVPAAGASVESILARTFDALVAIAEPHGRPNDRARPVLTNALQQQVHTGMVSEYGVKAEALFAGGPIKIRHADGRHERVIDLPLHDASSGHAGGIVSAFTANAETVNRNLPATVVRLMEIRIAEQTRPLGLFVLAPTGDDFAGRDIHQVRERIDMLTDSAAASGVSVHVEHRIDDVAHAIWAWRHRKAA